VPPERSDSPPETRWCSCTPAAAGLVDELQVHVVPLLLRGGARLLDNLGDARLELEQVRAVEAPGVTHVKYRTILRDPDERKA
jgi:hypothetical protein